MEWLVIGILGILSVFNTVKILEIEKYLTNKTDYEKNFFQEEEC